MLYPVILLPLYIYPNATSWTPVVTAIATNPAVEFQCIIGPNPIASTPDANYITGLESLKAYSNVQFLGYVDTAYTTRDTTAVETDVLNYSKWASLGTTLSIDGIFFDDVVSANTTANIAYMTTITNYARTTLGSGKDFIVYNPGIQVPSSWYTLADNIVAYEGTYAGFNYATVKAAILAQGSKNLEASSFIIYDGPTTAAAQTTLVDTVIGGNLGSFMTTTSSGYNDISALWAQFAAEMQAGS